MNWIALENITQLDTIKQESKKYPVLIFKHSTRCSVSRAALRLFENTWNFNGAIEMYFIDLLIYREVSNAVAEVFDITHQSPQVLLIENGKCVYHVSHESIDSHHIINFLKNNIKQ